MTRHLFWSFLIHNFGNPNFTFIKGDILDLENLKEAVKGKDVIVHLADGNIALNAPIIIDPNTAIYSTAGNVSATYAIITDTVSK